ncbi:MAG: hypothetical protein JW759_02535 [Candidatus Coatesbacteria bacterium]|nr:hypothetical protein [Candidatus Coatesbacteria bacterium]
MKASFLRVDGSRPTRRQKVIGVLIIAIAPALIYCQVWGFARLAKDSGAYLTNARDMANFRLPSHPDRAPLASIPAVLTGVTSEDSNASWLLLLQLLMHGAVVVIVVHIILDLGLPPIAAICAGTLLWLPPYVNHAGYILSEAQAELFLAFVFLGLHQFVKKHTTGWLWVATAFSSLVALVRPTFQALPLLLLLVTIGLIAGLRLKLIWRPYSLKIAIAFLMPFLVFVIGWSATNYVRFNFFGMTPLFGYNLSTRTVGVIERLPDSDAPIREVLIKYRDRALTGEHSSHTGLIYILKARRELEALTGENTFELSRHLTRLNLWLIVHAPLEYLRKVAEAGVTLGFPTAGPLSFGKSKLLQLIWSVLQLSVSFLFLAMPVLISLNLAFSRPSCIPLDRIRRLRQVFFFAISIVFYNWLISCAFAAGEARFLVPTQFLSITALTVVVWSGAQVWAVRSSEELAKPHRES